MTTKKLSLNELKQIIKEEMSSEPDKIIQYCIRVIFGSEMPGDQKMEKEILSKAKGTFFSHPDSEWIYAVSPGGNIQGFYIDEPESKRCAELWSKGKRSEALVLARNSKIDLLNE